MSPETTWNSLLRSHKLSITDYLFSRASVMTLTKLSEAKAVAELIKKHGFLTNFSNSLFHSVLPLKFAILGNMCISLLQPRSEHAMILKVFLSYKGSTYTGHTLARVNWLCELALLNKFRQIQQKQTSASMQTHTLRASHACASSPNRILVRCVLPFFHILVMSGLYNCKGDDPPLDDQGVFCTMQGKEKVLMCCLFF